MEKKTKKIKKQIHRAEDAINKRLSTLEYCLGSQQPATTLHPDFGGVTRLSQGDNTLGFFGRTRSFESVFNVDCGKDVDKYAKDRGQSEESEKRKNILFLRNRDKDSDKQRSSSCSSPCFHAVRAELSTSHNRQFYFPAGIENNISSKLWKTSRLDGDSCESTDEDCEKATDIPGNDSGYSTKLCSNSQGPSPSLSGMT